MTITNKIVVNKDEKCLLLCCIMEYHIQHAMVFFFVCLFVCYLVCLFVLFLFFLLILVFIPSAFAGAPRKSKLCPP